MLIGKKIENLGIYLQEKLNTKYIFETVKFVYTKGFIFERLKGKNAKKFHLNVKQLIMMS